MNRGLLPKWRRKGRFENILQNKPLFQGVNCRSESGVDAMGRFFLHARQDMRVKVDNLNQAGQMHSRPLLQTISRMLFSITDFKSRLCNHIFLMIEICSPIRFMDFTTKQSALE